MQYENTPERPQCGADTPAFLSDVYKKGTRAQKRQADVPQSGRSMIEMLGVLAIIGVLSVGGIAGYSKAMMKLKLNRWTNDITHLITNIQLMYMTQGQYSKEVKSQNITSTIKALDLIPDGMLDSGGNDIFGNKLKVLTRVYGGDYVRLNIQLNTKGGKDSVESCKQYFNIAAQHPALWYVGINSLSYAYCGSSAPEFYVQKTHCKTLPLNLALVSKWCTTYCTASCSLMMLLDNNVK